jgi:hypothetical protein
MLPGIIALAIVVGFQIARERACNRAFKHERNKWKEGGE